METIVQKVDPANPRLDIIRRAATILRAGGLVAFPTETVYGLGANALDTAAVARIFEAKGRPRHNPIIVHVADTSEAAKLVSTWTELANRLANRFWPGPLTLIVPKSEQLPTIVTGGGSTVAVRCPNNAVALALIRETAVPIAAPSANRSTELSPTHAEHVLRAMNGRIEMLLDGGPCPGGIESTVVDTTGTVPRLLRPGPITMPMLEAVCGRVESGATGDGIPRSPGLMAKHYSPRTPLYLADSATGVEEIHHRLRDAGKSVIAVGFELKVDYRPMPRDPEKYAALLYSTLHELDAAGYDCIVVELPPELPEWTAVRDRLIRAATK